MNKKKKWFHIVVFKRFKTIESILGVWKSHSNSRAWKSWISLRLVMNSWEYKKKMLFQFGDKRFNNNNKWYGKNGKKRTLTPKGKKCCLNLSFMSIFLQLLLFLYFCWICKKCSFFKCFGRFQASFYMFSVSLSLVLHANLLNTSPKNGFKWQFSSEDNRKKTDLFPWNCLLLSTTTPTFQPTHSSMKTL